MGVDLYLSGEGLEGSGIQSGSPFPKQGLGVGVGDVRCGPILQLYCLQPLVHCENKHQPSHTHVNYLPRSLPQDKAYCACVQYPRKVICHTV